MARNKRPQRKHKKDAKRTVAQHQFDIERIAKMHMEGQSFRQIAAVVGVTKTQVEKDWREWLAGHQEAAEESRKKQLAELNLIRRRASAGWERSCQPAEKRTVETISGADNPGRHGKKKSAKQAALRTNVTKTVESRNGDPRFLLVSLSCNKREGEIMGTDAPKKQEHSGPLHLRPVEELTDEELDRIIRGEGGEGTAPAPESRSYLS